MRTWKTNVAEPSLDELLGEEIVIAALRSAGLTAGELRAELLDVACRLKGHGKSARPRGTRSGGSRSRAAA